MHVSRVMALSSCFAVLGFASQLASAQNAAPFTLRYPPDGATVREKVPVKIPLASIPEGGYVAFYINDQFRVALAPTDEERKTAAEHPGQFYVYTWDTKVPMKVKGKMREEIPADGDYTITAKLFVPGVERDSGTSLKETSAVTVHLANKITDETGPLTLRYRYVDGSERLYDRKGVASVVAGLSQGMKGTGDMEFGAEDSELLLAVHDVCDNNDAIVRNMIKKLTVRQNNQETTYPTSVLPRALFQEVTPTGEVVYQNENVTFDQFETLGVPVTPTLELPPLPKEPVRVGDTWTADKVRVDIPGMAPEKEPVVSANCTLEGLEWEGGYPTAKIVQRYDSSKQGGFKEKYVQFGPYMVESPQIKFERTIHVAYRSGVLVKIERRLEITGKTNQAADTGATIGGSGYQGAAPSAGMSGMSGMMMPGMPGAAVGGMRAGGSSMMMPGAAAGGMRSGGMMPGSGGSSMMMPGAGGSARNRRGGNRGGMVFPGMGGSSMMMGSGGSPGGVGMSPGGSGMMGSGSGYMGPMTGGNTGPVQITLKSVTTTLIQPEEKKAPAK